MVAMLNFTAHSIGEVELIVLLKTKAIFKQCITKNKPTNI
jgi:hypothetical protein